MPHPAPAHKSFADRNSLYQQITDKIIAELEQGRVPWVQPWANVRAPLGLPKNATTGRTYSGVNVLILWIACMERGFGTQNWLTFRQALKIGAHVRKGEKGTTVVYADRFIPYRERMRAEETGDDPQAIPFLKIFTVFNADQCMALPSDIAPPPASPAENLIPAAGRGADPRDRRRYPHRRQPRLLYAGRGLHPDAAANRVPGPGGILPGAPP
jgi:antirestriction protein ArdC